MKKMIFDLNGLREKTNVDKKTQKSVQVVRKPSHSSNRRAENVSILFAVVSAAWTQNSAGNAPISASVVGGGAITVYSPLSKFGDILPQGTKILVFSADSYYYLLNAECPF